MQPLEEHALLGPAGEQFIKNTPWANPNHAAHKLVHAAAGHGHGHVDGRTGSPFVGGGKAITNGHHGALPLAGPSAATETAKSSGGPSKKVGGHSGSSGKASKTGAAHAVKPEPALAMS